MGQPGLAAAWPESALTIRQDSSTAAKALAGICLSSETSAFGHVCTPEEVADVVRYVVSNRASYVTGQRIGVDGGAF